MASVIALTGSPSARSRTAALSEHIALRLQSAGHNVGTVRVRDLPAEALLAAVDVFAAALDTRRELVAL
jgi:FMN reductase